MSKHEDKPSRETTLAIFDLSERQKRIIGGALTLLAALFIGWVILRLFLGAVLFVTSFSNVFLPLVTAFILAVLVKPYFEWLYKSSEKITPLVAVGIVYATILVPAVIVLMFFGRFFVGQLADIVSYFTDLLTPVVSEEGVSMSAVSGEVKPVPMYSGLREWMAAHWPGGLEFWDEHKLSRRLEAFMQERGDALAGMLVNLLQEALQIGRGAMARVTGLFGWFVVPVYFGFFLMLRPVTRKQRKEWFSFLKPESREDAIYLIDQFVDIMVSFFRGQLVIALIQALLYGLGFQVIGLRFGFVIGFSLGMLNVIPYLGSMIGLGVALPVALFQGQAHFGMEGGWLLLGLALGVFVLVQMFEGYILTPKIMGDRTGLHPMAIMVALFFWGTAFNGIIGMILAIPLTAFLVVFWRLAKHKDYLQEWF